MDFLQTLVLTVSLAAGYTPDYAFKYGDESVINQERFFSSYGAELSAMDDLFFVGVSTKTQALHLENQLSFAPIHDDFRFGGGVRLGSVEIGFEHYCLHPVQNYVYGNIVTDPTYGGGNSLYIKYEGRFQLFN